MNKRDVILALDFGGTKLSAAVLSTADRAGAEARPWLALERRASPAQPTFHTDLALMLAAARAALAGRAPAAIGVSFGGPADADAGRVIMSHHVAGWENQPLADILQAEFGAPVVLDNDANVAALGEWRYGAGRGASSLLYVTVSTGVGGGWVLDGRIWRGFDHLAGEIGHIVVQPDGPACLCGRRGCVEAIAAGPNLARRAQERLLAEPGLSSALRAKLPALTGADVAAAAQAGDAFATAALTEAARGLGLGLATAITLLNPHRVVLGGGVTKSGAGYWATVRQTVQANTLNRPPFTIDVAPAAFSDDAPLRGAVALVEAL